MLVLLLGTAGSWFLFDYAYYGNTLSLPAILKQVDATASLETKLLWTLGLFVIFAVPGYALAVMTMDRIGHRRLQFIGFAVMAASFLTLAAFAHLTTMIVPFLAIFGLSYFFVRVRTQYDHVRASVRSVPREHADDRTRDRRRRWQTRRVRRASSWSPNFRSTTGFVACS